MTRDACTQSGTLPSLSSSNPSTNLTPSIVEMSTNEDSLNSDDNKTKSDEEVSDRFFSLNYNFCLVLYLQICHIFIIVLQSKTI